MVLNPYIVLQDAAGNANTYKWLDLTNGSYVLNAALSNPFSSVGSGTVNLDTLQYAHIAVDTGGLTLTPPYTVTYDNLELNGTVATPPPPIQIMSSQVTPAGNNTYNVTLTWASAPSLTYSILTSTNLTTGFTTNATDIPSGGATTTAPFQLTGNRQFIKISQP